MSPVSEVNHLFARCGVLGESVALLVDLLADLRQLPQEVEEIARVAVALGTGLSAAGRTGGLGLLTLCVEGQTGSQVEKTDSQANRTDGNYGTTFSMLKYCCACLIGLCLAC